MALHSRSRGPRDRGGQMRGSSITNTTHATRHASHPRSTASIRSASPPASDDDGPPSKRRKLSIRSKQTTLDHFAFSQSAPPKPPTRVTVTQPHGPLLQSLNGVQTELDTNEDELSLPASGVATPKPKRVPKPAAQPASATTRQEDKRSLRSHDDGPRLKSELATYFPNYEDVIFDAPKDADFITVDSALYVTEDAAPSKSNPTTPTKVGKDARSSPSHTRKASANGTQSFGTLQRSPSNQFNGSPSLSLEMIARGLPEHPDDPLTDDHFHKSHRRAERKEKQLRNIEKERAMHEKVQLDRILDGLQGHDWLKVLGITGITDGEAKKYEAKRDYFIAEVQTLVNKFKEWREQERKQKIEKDALLAAREEAESEEPESEQSSVGPPSSDLNASAARQLQQETAIALKSLAAQNAKKGKETASTSATPTKPAVVTFAPPPQDVAITSFYEKRHLRDAALGKARSGRNVTAFGHPVPDVDEREFELPDDYASEDTLRANAREKRRRKRESVTNGVGS